MSFLKSYCVDYRYIIITLSLSLVSCSHFKNTTANNENEVSKKPMPERSVAQNHVPRSMIGNRAYYVPRRKSPQQNFHELQQKLESGKPLSEREMDNLFRALERGADPGNPYTFSELVGPSLRDSKGNTLLLWAVSEKGIVAGERLFSGAPLSRLIENSDATIRNKTGKKAFDVAMAQINIKPIVGWVLEELAEATKGQPILGEKEMDNLFRNLERGANPGNLFTLAELIGPASRDSKGNTLLHWAVSEKGIVAGERLFSGAPLNRLIERSDVTIRNNSGETALDVAEEEMRRVNERYRGNNVGETNGQREIFNRVTITGWALEELARANRGDSSSQEKLEPARGDTLSREERRAELDRLVEAAENKILEEAGLERSEISEGGCHY